MKQKIIWGTEGLSELLRGQKWLLVHGRSFEAFPLRKAFRSVDCVEFTAFTPNPLYEQVQAGLRFFQKESCTAIAAVGGGSAIDVAKCIKLFSQKDPETDLFRQSAEPLMIPLLAIPTTAGTGSESTRHAVIYRDGKKCSVSDDAILPSIALLEPELLQNLPPYQKKCTMLDALCQAIESWWSLRSSEQSVLLSKEAIALIRDNWEAYLERNDKTAAALIMRASNLSGQAINLTTTTAPHAMSYCLSALYGIPHGHAVALSMAPVWRYTKAHAGKLEALGTTPPLQEKLQDIEKEFSVEDFETLLHHLNMDARLHGGNRERRVEQLVLAVNPERLKNHPVLLSQTVLREIYEGMVSE